MLSATVVKYVAEYVKEIWYNDIIFSVIILYSNPDSCVCHESSELELQPTSKKIVKSKKFNYQIPTTTKDARGYVQATNIAMERLLVDLVRWLR